MSFRNPFGQYYNHADHIASMLLVFFLFVFVCLYSTRVRADDALAGFGATPQTEDPNSWANSEPAPSVLTTVIVCPSENGARSSVKRG